MSAVHVADIVAAPYQNNTDPEATHAEVRSCASWSAFPPPVDPSRPDFDPRAAGRRAVEKHADALRRLSD